MLRPLFLFVVSAVLVVSCKHKEEAPPRARRGGPPPVFDAVVASASPINRTIQTPGTILPNESTNLQAETSGRVVALNFKEGSFVQQGALLVKLFDDDLQAQLKKLEVQLQIAQTTAQRQKELLAINGTSQQDFDNASLTVSNIRADMELLRVNIARTSIRAPYSGRIGLRNISLGAYVTPATVITNISQVNAVKVEFTVPEKYTNEMQPGRMVQLAPDGTSKNYSAVIMASQNSISEDTRNLLVRAQVRNPDQNLKPGAFVQVSIAIGSNEPVIMIPSQAVIPSTRNKYVIVSREGKAVFQNVNTGFRDSSNVEMLEGINVGDTIVTNGLLTIKEGMPLKLKVSGKSL